MIWILSALFVLAGCNRQPATTVEPVLNPNQNAEDQTMVPGFGNGFLRACVVVLTADDPSEFSDIEFTNILEMDRADQEKAMAGHKRVDLRRAPLDSVIQRLQLFEARIKSKSMDLVRESAREVARTFRNLGNLFVRHDNEKVIP